MTQFVDLDDAKRNRERLEVLRQQESKPEPPWAKAAKKHTEEVLTEELRQGNIPLTPTIREETVITKAGRPRTGVYTKCADCGRALYIKKHRIEADKVYRCRGCASRKIAELPRKKVRAPAGAKELRTDKAITPEARRVLDECLNHSFSLFERAFSKAKSEYLTEEQFEDAYFETLYEFFGTEDLRNQMEAWIRELSGTADSSFIRGAIYVLQKLKRYFEMIKESEVKI